MSSRNIKINSRISIHALRGEGDQAPTAKIAIPIRFQSTPSVGRATRNSTVLLHAGQFQSTPSVGRATISHPWKYSGRIYFNPRPPWGGRHCQIGNLSKTDAISIHALRGEGDAELLKTTQQQYDFNPRPPWGGRPNMDRFVTLCGAISIHALRGEGDQGRRKKTRAFCHFNPRPPWGGRQ